MKTYDPGQVIVSFAGVVLQGFAPDTFVTVERDEDGWMKTAGADGEVCRTRNRNRMGRVTVTLLQSSQSNDALSALAILDELSAGGSGPLLIRDLNGTTLVAVQNAWIAKFANAEFGKELGNREWPIDCDKIEMLVGGALS